jgi:ribonuclease Z
MHSACPEHKLLPVLRLTFLGTSSSRPTVRRGVASLAVQRGGDLYLFDCGEGTQRQMMRYAVGFGIREIFISHMHADHYLGLPGLLRTMSLQDRTEDLIVRGPAGAEPALRAALQIGGDHLGFSVVVKGLEPGEEVSFGEYAVRAFRTDHTAASLGFALVEEDRLGRFDVTKARAAGVPEGPLFGRLHRGHDVELPDGTEIRASDLVGHSRPGRRLVYSADTRPCQDIRDAANGADLLVHEATFGNDDVERAIETRHSTAREAAEVAAAAGVHRLILTHFSARHSEQPDRLVAEARSVFPGVAAAEDGMAIEIPLREVTT